MPILPRGGESSMKIKEWFQKLDRMARAALSLGLVALVGVTAWSIVAPSQTDQPTLLFRCMEFNLCDDGSIQALIRVSAENMDRFSSAGVKDLQFNPDYIRPSYWDTVSGRQVILDAVSGFSGGTNLEIDPAMLVRKNGVSGLQTAFERGESTASGEMTAGQIYNIAPGAPGTASPNGSLTVFFTVDQKLKGTMTSQQHHVVRGMDARGQVVTPISRASFVYIDASGCVRAEDGYDEYLDDGYDAANAAKAGHGANLGSLSFWVDPDRLTDMVTRFSGVVPKDQDPAVNGADDFLIGYSTKAGAPQETSESWTITDYLSLSGRYTVNQRRPGSSSSLKGTVGNRIPTAKEAQVVFEFIFPKVLVKADVAGGGELVVSAYDAYTTGNISDIATTLQRYRPEITGTNADATQDNHIFNWGAANTAQHQNDYTIYRPALPGETPDYIECTAAQSQREKWAPNGYSYQENHTGHTHKGWVKVDPNTYTYSPKSGEYMVTQNFYYMEDLDEDGIKETEKKYPLPMRVHLTVTPVELVSVNADKLAATYKQSEAQDTTLFPTTSLTGLDLPNSAILGLSPVPSSLVLTMPIDASDWQPATIGGLTTTGTPAQSQNWPDVGDYQLPGPGTQAIKNYVETNYPWVTTTPFTGSIQATRTIVADAAYVGKEYKATYVSTGDDGTLTLQVNKEDGQGNSVNFANPSAFRTYLPGGVMIDTATELPGTPQANGAYSSEMINAADNSKADLVYRPGAPSASRTSHQEDVARSINLGGWFHVSVQENGGSWSDLIPVYVPPRTNYYTAYSAPTGGLTDYSAPGGGSPYYNFDFTGYRAGLYPFYVSSILPTKVVLPVGYTVTTTYDGLSGAEPGQLDQFRVDEWASAEVIPASPSPTPTHTPATQPPWPEGVTVDYGDPGNPPATPAAPADPTEFTASTVYGAYGTVVNSPRPIGVMEEKTHVRVEIPAALPTPTPDPSASPTPTPTPTPTPDIDDLPEEKIILTHGSELNTNNPLHNSGANDKLGGLSFRTGTSNPREVEELTYESKIEGYIDRQTFTLVIQNNGTEPIYGLAVHTDYMNGDTTAHKPDGRPHFEVTKQPSAYLAPGGQTTFTLTYVHNLLTGPQSSEIYRDHIVITSNSGRYNDLSHASDSQNRYLKDFYAQFTVTQGDLFKVTVVTDPVNGSLGTADIVKGLTYTLPSGVSVGGSVTETGTSKRPDLTLGTSTYPKDHEFVWIHADPTDENKVKEVYYDDPTVTGGKVPLYVYQYLKDSSVTGDTDETAYFFKMPERDVTVHVVFYEPILSKLRLDRLLGYAGTDSDAQLGSGITTGSAGLVDHAVAGGYPAVTDLDKWNHTMRHHVRWYDDSTNIIQSNSAYCDIQCPNGHSAPKAVFQADTANPGQVFCPYCSSGTASFIPGAGNGINNMSPADSSRPTRPDYIMVLGDYANQTNAGEQENDLKRVQLDVRLRANPNAPDIDDVTVAFSDITNGLASATTIASTPSQGKTWAGPQPPAPTLPTSHHTAVFEAPVRPSGSTAPATKTVRITLSCLVTQDMLNYDPDLVADNKHVGDIVSRSFDVVIIRRGDMDVSMGYGNSPKGMIYNNTTRTNTEKAADWTAFMDNGFTFVGLPSPAVVPSKASALKNTYWQEAWVENNYKDQKSPYGISSYNGDRDEYALFIILNKSFQDPGLTVKNTAGLLVPAASITRTAVVELLDTAATTQIDRFKGQMTGTAIDTVTLDLGKGNEGLVTSAATDVINNWWQKTDQGTGTTTVYNIRPGIYDVTYSFKDYDGVTPLEVRRKLIVLSPVGDVNADRSVDNNDITILKNRITDPLGCMATVAEYRANRLFRYRCCDTNNDRNINNIDANQLRHALSGVVDYYKPTDYRS